MTFTADNLPETARATNADMARWFVIAPVRAAANQHAALVLDRLDAAHGGRLSALLNGEATALTDAPPPRKVEVTPEVMKAFKDVWYSSPVIHSTEPGFENFLADQLAALRVAFAYANEQAEARESEEIAQLKGEVEQLTKERDLADLECQQTDEQLRQERSLHAGTKSRAEQAERERDEARQELAAIRAHADKLEAMLTVEGADGPVKTWLPFERRFPGCVLAKWEAAELALGYSVNGRPQELFARVRHLPAPLQLRQSPAPAVEPLKRWRIKPSDEDAIDTIITKPMTRADAEAIGDVIGEAGE